MIILWVEICATWFPSHVSLTLLTHLTFGNHQCVLCMYESISIWLCLFVLIFRFHIEVKSYSICLSLSDISLSTIRSRSIHVVANVKISFFFIVNSYFMNIGSTFLIHSSTDKHLCYFYIFSSVQFSCSVVSNYLWPHGLHMAGLPVHHQLPEFTQTLVHWVRDVIQSSHPLLSPSTPNFNLSQHQGLFKWVSSSHQVAKVLEFQLQHQSFQWIFRTYFLRMDWLDLLAVQKTLKSLL